MLFGWFFKFGLFSSRDDYSVHDYIKKRFCPEYISTEEFDEKERLLRDTPGPTGIKYAYFVGNRVSGIIGAVFAITALLVPMIIAAALLAFAYPYLFTGGAAMVTIPAIRGVHAVVAGLIFAHMFKISYFNKVGKKSMAVILPAALIFMFLPNSIGMRSVDLMPFFMISVVVVGIILGFAHERVAAYMKTRPPKYIDPYSKKAKKLRDKQLREEEWELQKYRSDDEFDELKEKIKKRISLKDRYRD